MYKSELFLLGQKCKEFRKSQGLYQFHVAKDTGYSKENVSAFETGRNDNCKILLWYFRHGMTYKYLTEDNNESI